jgi:Tol biopolymer transport system component
MAVYPKLLLAGALIMVSAGTASPQQGRAAGDKDSMLAFVSERDGNSEIYVMNVDGTGLLRLTNDAGRDADPAWSPDGKRIAFASDREGSSDIYVINADGSHLVRRTQTGRSEAPAWSPDGSKIAFSSLRDGQFGIYVMSVDGDWANPTRVGYDRGWNTYPAWSPDGGQIAFVSDWRAFDFLFDVYVMNADGSNITSLFAGPFFSKDGQIFYFQPSWSPDGRKIAVVVCGYAWDNCYPSSSIAIANGDGDGLTTLVQAGGFARPTWSPDGGTIAFSSKACRNCAGSLRYVSTDGTKSGLIFSNGHSPAWRP